MLVWKQASLWVLLAVLLACAPAASTQSAHSATGPVGGGATPKHITLAVVREQDLRPIAAGPALVSMPLLHSGLSSRGEGHIRRPRLAEALPSLENGLWTLFPDGRMETTWRLR